MALPKIAFRVCLIVLDILGDLDEPPFVPSSGFR